MRNLDARAVRVSQLAALRALKGINPGLVDGHLLFCHVLRLRAMLP